MIKHRLVRSDDPLHWLKAGQERRRARVAVDAGSQHRNFDRFVLGVVTVGLIERFARRQIVQFNINELRVVNFWLFGEANGRQQRGARGRGYEFYESWHDGLLTLLSVQSRGLKFNTTLDHDAAVGDPRPEGC